MISSPVKPAAAAQPANVSPQKLDTNEQAIPLPYFFGRRWLPVLWNISQIYNPTPKTTTRKVGKGGSTSTTVYYGDVAGRVALGAGDWFEGVEVNGERVWAGGIDRDEANPDHCSVAIPGVCEELRLHWGTATQAGAWIVLNTGGEEHPNYPDQIVVEMKGLQCNNAESVPNVRVLIERAPRFAGLDENRSQEGANGITAIAEILENEFYGLGLTGIVDLTSAAATAEAIKRPQAGVLPGSPEYVANLGYLSGFLDRQQSAADFIGAIAENYDAWIRCENGKLIFGLFPHDGVTPTGLPELSLHDFEGDPDFTGPGFDDESVVTDVVVKGPDRDWNMETSSQKASNEATRERLQETRQITVDRPFVITSYQQIAMANELVVTRALPFQAVDVSIRREKARTLRPGDRFILNYGPNLFRQVMRVARRRDPSSGGTIELSIVAERGLAPLGFISAPNPVPSLPAPAAPVVVAHARIVQLPFDYSETTTVVALCERPSANSDGFRVLYSEADVTYDELGFSRLWALRGTIAGSISSGAASVTINASGPDLALLAGQSAAAQADDTLLCFFDDEISSIGAVTALGGGQYSAALARGRFGTAAAAHTDGAVVYILRQSDLVPLHHGAFPRTAVDRYFKLPTFTAADEQAAADALKITFTFADTRPLAPTGVTATPLPGYNLIEWTPPASGAAVDEFHVYRGATSSSGSSSWIGDTRDLLFSDADVVQGEGWYYFVSSEDLDDVEGAKSASAYCVTVAAPLYPITPADPSPITKTGEDTRVADDGSVKSCIILSVPGRGAAEWVDIKFRINISGEFKKIGEQRSSSAVSFRLDDLAPGEVYQVASMARNPGAASALVLATGSPFTAPKKTTAPTPPAAFTFFAGDDDSIPRPPPTNFGVSALIAYAMTIDITRSPDPDVVEYHVIGTTVDTDGAADAIYDSVGPEFVIKGTRGHYFALAATTRYIRIKAVDSSRNTNGAWRAGPTDCSSYLKKPTVGATMDGYSQVRATKLVSTSSRRYKQNIRRLTAAAADAVLDHLIERLYDDRNGDRRNVPGFIAEQAILWIECLVVRDERGRPEGIDYVHLIPLLAASLRGQRKQSAALERKVRQLQLRLARLTRTHVRNRNSRRS